VRRANQNGKIRKYVRKSMDGRFKAIAGYLVRVLSLFQVAVLIMGEKIRKTKLFA
jgi:hypothetical protein